MNRPMPRTFDAIRLYETVFGIDPNGYGSGKDLRGKLRFYGVPPLTRSNLTLIFATALKETSERGAACARSVIEAAFCPSWLARFISRQPIGSLNVTHLPLGMQQEVLTQWVEAIQKTEKNGDQIACEVFERAHGLTEHDYSNVHLLSRKVLLDPNAMENSIAMIETWSGSVPIIVET